MPFPTTLQPVLAKAPWPHLQHGPRLTNTGEVENRVGQGQGLTAGVVGNLNLQRDGAQDHVD